MAFDLYLLITDFMTENWETLRGDMVRFWILKLVLMRIWPTWKSNDVTIENEDN